MADQLSGGQARRLMIARALVHQPDVLFLDEPTAGLDPQTRVNLWDILKVLHDQGQTILLTTHYMEEAEALCDKVAVVDHGKVLAEGSVDELLADSGAQTIVTVRFEEPVPDGLAERAGLAGAARRHQGGDGRRPAPRLQRRPRGPARRPDGHRRGQRPARPRRLCGQAQPGDRLPCPDRPRVPGVADQWPPQSSPPTSARPPAPGRPGQRRHRRADHRCAGPAPDPAEDVRRDDGPRVPRARQERAVHVHPRRHAAAAVRVRLRLRPAQDRQRLLGRRQRGAAGASAASTSPRSSCPA